MASVMTEPVGVKERLGNVLIIDDDPALCEQLLAFLDSRGYSGATAADGQTALRLLREEQFDLILIDVLIPGVSGVETLRQIKGMNRHAVILIMVGQSQVEGLVSKTLWMGSDGILRKPFEPQEILMLIERKNKQQQEIVSLDLKHQQIADETLKYVPEALARKYKLLPLSVENGRMKVAMADPRNLYAIEDLRVRTQMQIEPIQVSEQDVEAGLASHYGSETELQRQIGRIEPEVREEENDAARQLSSQAIAQTPIARAVELLVRQAVKDRASDIHIEPQEDHLRIRYRIDGVLHDGMELPKRVHAPLISRIKVLSKLNIAERRRPQDGQFSVDINGRSVDIRVATVDTVLGEMAVLRVLDKTLSARGLGELGFLPDMREKHERLIKSPWGIILCSGPTGSGKTSTLYSSINELDHTESKIITIEDPVEYRFEGISQVQVNRQAGITFASGLRAAMRLDPDTILVGEIRDQETAGTAVQASLTGHLVLSSIHANDTVGAVLRLIDLGVEPFLVTSSLLAVISQRLARRVCPHCGIPGQGTELEHMAYTKAMGEDRETFVVGQGCDYCAGTGFRGRIALFEMLTMSDEIRRMVLAGANSDEIRTAAERSGMETMLIDGMRKVDQGLTTPSEVMKHAFSLSQR